MSARLARCWHTNKLLPQRLSRLPSLSNLCFFTSLHSTRFLSLPCIVKILRIYKYFHTLRTDESAKEITLCGTLLTPRNFVTAMTLFWSLSAEPIYLVAVTRTCVVEQVVLSKASKHFVFCFIFPLHSQRPLGYAQVLFLRRACAPLFFTQHPTPLFVSLIAGWTFLFF